jgi:hypothetical protein
MAQNHRFTQNHRFDRSMFFIYSSRTLYFESEGLAVVDSPPKTAYRLYKNDLNPKKFKVKYTLRNPHS